MTVKRILLPAVAMICCGLHADVRLETHAETGETQLVADIPAEIQERFFETFAVGAEMMLGVKARLAAYNRFQSAMGLEDVPLSTSPVKAQLKIGDTVFFFEADGSLWCDSRFLLPEERPIKLRMEEYFREFCTIKTPEPPPAPERPVPALPVFCGFEDARYQQYDELILRLVDEFNRNRAEWADATEEQSATIHDLRPAIVKSLMIEESGGWGPMSVPAWKSDPMQVNVPGDWDNAKRKVGLARPQRRNEGAAADNIRAAIKYLVRKGFGPSGAPARTRPERRFDGWRSALRRYNGRNERLESGRRYKDAYAERIMKRAESPKAFVPISRDSGYGRKIRGRKDGSR